MDSEIDGVLISPASSNRSITPSITTADGTGRQHELIEDTEMHELSDTQSPINLEPQSSDMTQSSSDIQPSNKALNPSQTSTIKARNTPSRGNKGKMMMVGGNQIESHHGNNRLRSEGRNHRNQPLSDWVNSGESQDGRGMKLLDEDLMRALDFGDPFLDLYNANHPDESTLIQPSNASLLNENQNTSVSAHPTTDASIPATSAVLPGEIMTPITPASPP
ncbi:hypothetical protein DFH28DRAFT_297169 [Melampsora americana]|nr:hypothetical protein DFH28DRAFT_297169 [Melampsora americana]